jgi:AraC family transcriptional regulator
MTKNACIEKALLFIEENLKGRINLEDIADAANLSQWYFHRLFRICTGFCVNDYMRKRRLCEASHELIYTRRPIRQIATDYQFESQAAFTRSFCSVAGLTPGRFRRQLASMIHFPAISLDNSFKHLKKGAIKMNQRFEKLDTIQVVGVSCRANPSESLMRLWEDFMRRMPEIRNIIEPSKAYQVCVYEASAPDKEEYTFIAGMSVKDFSHVPDGMLAHTVKPAEYAVFEHHGLLDTMHKSYEYIYGVWLQESGYQMADADALEIYDERFKPGQEDSMFEIWVPLKKN